MLQQYTAYNMPFPHMSRALRTQGRTRSLVKFIFVPNAYE